VFDGEIGEQFLEHIIVYECHDNTPKHDRLARLRGKKCHRPDFANLQCNSIAAYWSRGSKVNIMKVCVQVMRQKKIQFLYLLCFYLRFILFFKLLCCKLWNTRRDFPLFRTDCNFFVCSACTLQNSCKHTCT
jgi:hypothetical protein